MDSSDGGGGFADEPTVLLVAAGERLAPALKARLVERGVSVELATIETAARTAFVVAPDLVVLAGRAAEEGGADVLAALADKPVTATVPVVVIADEGSPRPRLSTFRHGLVAVIARSASADEMARRIAELARELPERPGESAGRLEETSVEELVELFAESLRSGILSVSGQGGESAQVVLRADRPVAETIAELVERIRPLVASREQGPLHYEFHESAPSRISSLDVGEDVDVDGSFAGLAGRRILLVEQSAPRSDVLAQHLRAAGATVAVVDGDGRGLELAQDLTPELVLIDGSGVESWAVGALRTIRRDPRLRWASLLVVDATRLWANPRHPDLAVIAPKIAALVGPDEDLARRVSLRKSVASRLDVIGPIRMLRALATTGVGLRMRVNHPRARVLVDLAEGLIAGATAHLPGRSEPVAEGPAAVGVLLGLGSGRVQITHEDSPKTANVMAPIDDALAASATEDPVVAPSLPPPSMPPPAREDVPDLKPGELPGLVRRLEALLGALSEDEQGGSESAVRDRVADDERPEARTEARKPMSVARPSELPGFDQPDDGDEATGHYDPEMVQRLRARMRRSSQGVRAVKEDPERVREAPARPTPRAVVPPPAHMRAARPLPPKKKGAGANEGPDTAATGAGAFGGASPVKPPAAKARGKAELGPLPPASLPAKAAARPETPAGTKPVRPTPPGPSRPRVRRRAPTLVLGSVAADAGAIPSEQEEASSSAEVLPSSGVRDRAVEPTVEPPSDVGRAGHAAAPPSPAPSAAAASEPATSVDEAGTAVAEAAAEQETRTDAVAVAVDEGEPTATSVDIEATDALEPPTRVDIVAPPDDPVPEAAAEAPPLIASPQPPADAHPRGAAPARSDDVFAQWSAAPAPPVVTPPSPPSRPRWLLPAVAAGAGVFLLLTVGLAAWALSGGALSGGDPEEEPEVAALPADEASTAADGPADLDATEAPVVPAGGGPSTADPPVTERAEPERAPAPSGAPLGPGPGDPVEGVDAEFDLARLGIERVEPPDSRRARARMVRDLIREGNRLRNDGQLDDAETRYRELLAVFPDNARATAGMARVHMEREEAREAILFAQRLARLRPRYASNYVLLGDALLLGENRAAARRAFQRAVELEPRWAPARRRLEELETSDR